MPDDTVRRALDYTLAARDIRELVVESDLDDEFSPRRRASVLRAAMNRAHADLARIDPAYTQVVSCYLVAAHEHRPRSRWVRSRVGAAVEQAMRIPSPDRRALTNLRGLRERAWESAGRRTRRGERALARAIATVERLRADPDTDDRWLVRSLTDVAERHLSRGHYGAAVDSFDAAAAALAASELPDPAAGRLEQDMAERLIECGEFERATALMESQHARLAEHRADEFITELPDLIVDTTHQWLLGRGRLAVGRADDAEALLRSCLDRLDQNLDVWLDPRIYKLRHTVTYELGCAMWQQGRQKEATTRFRRALRLVTGPEWADEELARQYGNAVVFSTFGGL